MSISGALNNALSGLRASSRAGQVVASNIANALNPGYARRTIELDSNKTGSMGGVQVSGITRHSDPILLHDRRMAGAETEFHTTTNRFLSDLETRIGTPNQPTSLAGRLSTLSANLITAASRPDAEERLDTVVSSAKDLASAIHSASHFVQDARTRADNSIGTEVRRLNDALKGVETLNHKIIAGRVDGTGNLALKDERQFLVDQISQIVPLRQIERRDGSVALYSKGGAVLVDGRASEIGFEPVNAVSASMTIGDGSLSELTLNGLALTTDSTRGQLSGGSLGAHFAVRDELGVFTQSQLDAFARDLVTRFESVAEDSSRPPGAPGLFTDQGNAFDPLAENGLASRLTVNAAVDAQVGGESWRLRDGLQMAAPGDVGQSSILQAYTNAIEAAVVPASGGFGGSPISLDGVLSTMGAKAGNDRARSDQLLAFATSQHAEFKQKELSQGVDTDAEMQQLILIQQAYAVNARMIETVDEMMDSLLRI